MPRAKRNLKKQTAGGCCAPQVDITRYSKPCSSNNQLPLDGLFFKYFPQSGGCGCGSPIVQSGGNIRAGTEVRPYIGAQQGAGKKRKTNINQHGKGFSVMPDVNIGNRAEIKGYPDWAPPIVMSKGMVFSENLKPLCGQQIGGKNKKSKPNIKKMRGGNCGAKHYKSQKRSMKPVKSSKSKRQSKSKKQSKSKRQSKSKKQRGGVVSGMSGVNSNFSGNMSTREFGCRQPMWNPNCV